MAATGAASARAAPDPEADARSPAVSAGQPAAAPTKRAGTVRFHATVVDQEFETARAWLEVEEARAQRKCRGCGTEPITTAALPCRHSALCGKCMHEARRTTGRCPDCGAHIDHSMDGDFETDFVDLAPVAVRAIIQTFSCLTACLYEIIYGNLGLFVVISLVATVVSALCHWKFDKPSCANHLARLAICVGYLPCVAVFSVVLEKHRHRTWLSREDFVRPWFGIAKTACLAIVGPIVGVTLLLPYIIYVVLFRKVIFVVLLLVLKLLLRALIHLACYSYMFLLRPLLVAAGHVLQRAARCSFHICGGIAWLLGEVLQAVPTSWVPDDDSA